MDFYLHPRDRVRPETILLRAGYHQHRDPHTGSQSFAKRLGTVGHYPRFHAYLETRSEGIRVGLHLDQKQPSYGSGSHAHAGEYEGPLLLRERDRIVLLAQTITAL